MLGEEAAPLVQARRVNAFPGERGTDSGRNGTGPLDEPLLTVTQA